MKYHRNSFALCCWLLKSIVIFILFYLPHPRYVKVPGPEMELAPQQWSETQQWNCWILNQMSHGNFTFFFPQILHIKLLAGKCADIKANKKKIWCKAKEQEKKGIKISILLGKYQVIFTLNIYTEYFWNYSGLIYFFAALILLWEVVTQKTKIIFTTSV